jgi:hypothetical protein
MPSSSAILNKGESPAIPLPEQVETDIVVLPDEVDRDGTGLYPDSALSLVKELRSLGVTAEYQHPQDARSWTGEKSFGAVAANWILGIASNAGWAALCVLLRRGKDKARVRIKLARCTQTATQITWDWFEVEGEKAEVADVIERLGFAPPPLEPGNEEDGESD